MVDKSGAKMITPQHLFLFTSNILNEEQNAALFESVLTTQHSLQHETEDGDFMADFVLEMADCEAFIKMFDRSGKGWLDVDDLGVALTPQNLASIRSTDESISFNITGEISTHEMGGSEARICALLAHIVTSESIFLTKIQGAYLK